ncbi:MAG: hypothetical protein EBS89_03890, partial [Proteobacteria bacterium]|nr:hypothetical protein [Pseudomonadota bacterium]
MSRCAARSSTTTALQTQMMCRSRVSTPRVRQCPASAFWEWVGLTRRCPATPRERTPSLRGGGCKVVGVSQVRGRKIHHGFIGSCAAASFEDLQVAADILRHRRIHPDVRFFVTPGTQQVLSQAEEAGIMKVFVDAGAAITAPGCGVCAGGKIGPLADEEVSINTGTRNDYGRLGSPKADIYLASAACGFTGRVFA